MATDGTAGQLNGQAGQRGQWRTSGIGAEAYAALADGMLASEVWSLLLDLFERRAARREPWTWCVNGSATASLHRPSSISGR